MNNILEKQQEFFKSGKTLDLNFRLDYLKKLRTVIKEKEVEIANALKEDLGKSHTEAYMCEIGLAVSEITYFLKNLKKLKKKQLIFKHKIQLKKQ